MSFPGGINGSQEPTFVI